MILKTLVYAELEQ